MPRMRTFAVLWSMPQLGDGAVATMIIKNYYSERVFFGGGGGGGGVGDWRSVKRKVLIIMCDTLILIFLLVPLRLRVLQPNI